MNEAWVLDWLLALTLIFLAWQVLSITDLFKAIVLFIATGLIMALTWVRLEAVDIALAEAAIGAGLTGVLFLTTLSHLSVPRNSHEPSDSTPTQENQDDDSR